MADVKIKVETSYAADEEAEKIADLKEKKDKAVIATFTLLAHQTIANAKKVMNYSVNNHGNFTGDYTKASAFQFGMDIVGDIASIGVGASAGPVGLAIAVGGVALSRTLEVITHFQDNKHKEIEAQYLQQRSGNSLTNGSRGTEN